MQRTIEQPQLLLTHAKKAAEIVLAQRAIDPGSGVNITISGRTATVYSGNAVASYRGVVTLADEGDETSIGLPAARLAGVVTALDPSTPLNLSVADAKITMTSGRYKAAVKALDVGDGSEAETLEDPDAAFELTAEIAALLHAGAGCADQKAEDNQPFRHANLDVKDGTVTVTSTDRHRLLSVEATVPTQGEASVLVDDKILAEVVSLAEEAGQVVVRIQDGLLEVDGGDRTYRTQMRAASSPYPNWRQLVPDAELDATVVTLTSPNVLVGKHAPLDRVGKTLDKSDKDSYIAVVTANSEKVAVQAQNRGEVLNAEDELLVGDDVQVAGDEIKMGFNIRLLRDVLKRMPADAPTEARFYSTETSGGMKPLVVHTTTERVAVTGLVMPVVLGD